MAVGMLHGASFGKDAGAQNVFSGGVKWLQPAIKGSLCVTRVRRHARFDVFWFLDGVLQRAVANRIGMAFRNRKAIAK